VNPRSYLRKRLPLACTVAAALGAVAVLGTSGATAQYTGTLDATITAWGLSIPGTGGQQDAATLAVAPGAEATLPLFVAYDAPSTTPGPVTVQVTLPAALQFVRAEALIPEGQGLKARWVCTSAAPQVTCELRNPNGAEPFPLLPEHSARLFMIVRGVAVPAMAPGAAPAPLGDIAANVSVPNVDGVLTAETSLKVVASNIPPAPSIVVSDVSRNPTGAGRSGPEGYDVYAHNVGSGPAAPSGKRPSVVLSNLVPPKRLKGTTVSGDGWSCRVVGGFTCTYRRSLQHGASAAPLRVRWNERVDTGRIDFSWTLNGTANGDTGAVPVSFPMRLVMADTVVRMDVHVTAPKGVHVVAGRAPAPIEARITNTGAVNAAGASVRVTPPIGVSVRGLTKGWRCSGRRVIRCHTPGALAMGASATVTLGLSAPDHASGSTGRLLVEPLGPRGLVRGQSHEVPVSVLDPGDPTITPRLSFRKGRIWTDWTNGGTQDASVGDAFAYRIALVNTGGVAMLPGDVVRVRQPIGWRMGRVRVLAGPGVRCAAPAVSCSVTASRRVAPGATAGVVTVTTFPQRPGAQKDLGKISTNILGARAQQAIPLEVTTPPESMQPGMRVTHDPTSGGVGSLVMAVKNTGTSTLRGVRATGVLPAGLSVLRVRASGAWSCGRVQRGATRIACAYRVAVAPSVRTSGVTIWVAASGAARTATVRWSAQGRTAEGLLQQGNRLAELPVRAPISAKPSASPRMLAGIDSRAGRVVTLDGAASDTNGAPLNFEWSQRCLTPADARTVRQCRGVVTPPALIADPQQSATSATLPPVASRTTFVFSLSVDDGSAQRTATVHVIAAPDRQLAGRTGRWSGLSPAAASLRNDIIRRARAANSSRKAAARGQARARKARAASNARVASSHARNAPVVSVVGAPVVKAEPGDDVTLVPRAKGRWTGSISYKWVQVAGAPVTVTPMQDGTGAAVLTDPGDGRVVPMRVTARDELGRTATSQMRVMVGDTPSAQGAQVMLAAWRAARAARPLPIDLGAGITGTIAALDTPPTRGDTFAISGADIAIGVLRIRGGAGSLDATGLHFTDGQLELPREWNIPTARITRGAPLDIGFAVDGQPAALTGDVRSVGAFALFPLPGGWKGTTGISFAQDAWRVTATATGDETGTADLEGTLQRDGSFDVAVASKALVTVADTPLDLTGRASGRGEQVTSSVQGAANSPLVLGDGVTARDLVATWAPSTPPSSPTKPVVGGRATLRIESGDASPLDLSASLSYARMLDWGLGLTGKGGNPWTPIPGLSVRPGDLTGSVADVKGTRTWGITGKIADWRATSRVSASSLKVAVTDTCGDDPAPACPDAELFIRLDGTVGLDAAGAGNVKAPMKAVLGLGKVGGIDMTASLPDLGVGPGMRLTDPALDVSYGMAAGLLPDEVERPDFGARDENGFGVRVSGGVSIPSFGRFDHVTADVTDRGWAFGGFSDSGVPLGAGDGRQDGAWFGWASFDASMKVRVPGRGETTSQVPANRAVVTGVYTSPDWFTSLIGSQPEGGVGTITLNPATGGFAGDITQPGEFSLPSGASRVSATGLVFIIRGDASGVSVKATSRAGVEVRPPGGGPLVAAPPLTLGLAADAPSDTVTGTMSPADGGDWNDAFGVPGLAVRGPVFTLSVNNRSRATSLQLTGRGGLPAGVTAPLAVPADAPISVVGDLAKADGCVNVQVGDTKGTRDVLSLDGGAMRAKYFSFILAPAACQSAPGAAPTAAGMALAFDGEVVGYEARVALPVQLSPGLVMDGSVGMNSMLMGPLRLFDAKVGIHVNAQSGQNEVDLSGGVSMLNATIPVSGPLGVAGGVTSGSLRGTPTGPVVVSGFTIRDLSLTVPVSSGPSGATAAVQSSGAVEVLGDVIRVPAFTAALDNGRVETTSFDVQANPTLAPGTSAPGRYTMTHTASTGRMAFSGQVVVHTLAGVDIGFTERPATMTFTPNCANVVGNVFSQGVFGAEVSGPIALTASCAEKAVDRQGNPVTLARGDYAFASGDGTSVKVGGFQQTGSVYLGLIGGTPHATMKTTLKLTPRAMASTTTVAGTFTPSGEIDLKGTGRMELAGIPLDVDVTAKGIGTGDVKVLGVANFGWLSSKISMNGEFTVKDNVQHVTLEARLQRQQVGGTGKTGFYVRDAKFRLVDTPTETGFTADVRLGSDDPDIGLGRQIMADGLITFFRPGDGGDPLYHGSLHGDLDMSPIGGNIQGTVDLTNCEAECTSPIPTKFRLSGTYSRLGFTFGVDVNVGASGGFDASASTGRELCTGDVDLLVVRGHACISYTITLRMLSKEPFASLSASASANIRAQYWAFGWSDWKDVGVNVNASVQLDPFRLCVSIVGHDVCI